MEKCSPRKNICFFTKILINFFLLFYNQVQLVMLSGMRKARGRNRVVLSLWGINSHWAAACRSLKSVFRTCKRPPEYPPIRMTPPWSSGTIAAELRVTGELGPFLQATAPSSKISTLDVSDEEPSWRYPPTTTKLYCVFRAFVKSLPQECPNRLIFKFGPWIQT